MGGIFPPSFSSHLRKCSPDNVLHSPPLLSKVQTIAASSAALLARQREIAGAFFSFRRRHSSRVLLKSTQRISSTATALCGRGRGRRSGGPSASVWRERETNRAWERGRQEDRTDGRVSLPIVHRLELKTRRMASWMDPCVCWTFGEKDFHGEA